MASATYTHKVLTIKLCIANDTVKKKEINIKNPSTDDWNKNLSSLLSKIKKKFKFLSNMDESEWIISINGTTIDKTDSEQLKQVLSTIPPIAVVEIMKKVFRLKSKLSKYDSVPRNPSIFICVCKDPNILCQDGTLRNFLCARIIPSDIEFHKTSQQIQEMSILMVYHYQKHS